MSAPPSLLLLAPGTSYRPRRFLEAARVLGVPLVIGTNMPSAFRHLGCRIVELELQDATAAAEQLGDLDVAINAALGTDDATALSAAYVSRKLGLSGNAPEAIAATRDKRLLRTRLAGSDVSQPKYTLAPGGRLPKDVQFPCVIKPCFLSGSQGVVRADNPEQLERARLRIARILEQHPARTDRSFSDLLVEEYIEGPEVALEGLLHNGHLEVVALFDKPDPLQGPYFEESCYVTPSRLPQSLQERLRGLVQQATAALGLQTGPVHAELRLGCEAVTSPVKPRIIEVAARSIGGMCSRAVELFAGNLEERLISQAVGWRVPALAVSGAAAGVMMIPIPKTGILKSVRGVSEARAVAGVDSISITTRPGDRVIQLPEGASYLGFIFAAAATPAAVEAALRNAHSKLGFEIAPALRLLPST